MKKAYVKPVFVAETFVMTSNVAACDHHTGQIGNEAMVIDLNKVICDKDNGHKFSSGELNKGNSTLWKDYALVDDNQGTLFDTSNRVCDFVWLKPSTGVDQVQVWGDENNNLVTDHDKRNTLFDWNNIAQTFMQFFAGCSATEKEHGINYQNLNFNS